MSFVFIKFPDREYHHEAEFDGLEEIIETGDGGQIVVAKSLKDPRGYADWAGCNDIDLYINDGIPEAMLSKYASAKNTLKLQKEREQESEPVELKMFEPEADPNIKSCPFCGDEPTSDSADDVTPAIVYCASLKCRLQPVLVGSSCEESLADLLEFWNYRPNE